MSGLTGINNCRLGGVVGNVALFEVADDGTVEIMTYPRQPCEPWTSGDIFTTVPITSVEHLHAGDLLANLYALRENPIAKGDIEPTIDPRSAVAITCKRILGIIHEAHAVVVYEEQLCELPKDLEIHKLDGIDFILTLLCASNNES